MTPPAAAPPLSEIDLTGLERVARRIRCRVLAHVLSNNGGYMSQACSSAELLAALYCRVARLGALEAPLSPRPFGGVPSAGFRAYTTGAEFHGVPSPDGDRLILSPAHYALAVYAALIEVGRLTEGALDQFNKDGSTVEMIGAEHSPGFETTTGSLAQALSQAGGIALGRRLKGHSGRTWVFLSDGELQEGQTWEALAALAYHRLDTVRVVVDVNGQQCDGPMESIMRIEPVARRVEAFGASVAAVDGHDLQALVAAMEAPSDRPHVVLAYTDPVRGLPLMNERRPTLHYLRFTGPQERARYQAAYEQMAKEVA